MKNEIISAVQEFKLGRLSESQLVAIVFQNLNEATFPTFLNKCPPELLVSLRVVVEASPKTDAEWAKLKFIEKRVGDRLSDEDSEAAVNVLRNRYRAGVEMMRKYMERG